MKKMQDVEIAGLPLYPVREIGYTAELSTYMREAARRPGASSIGRNLCIIGLSSGTHLGPSPTPTS